MKTKITKIETCSLRDIIFPVELRNNPRKTNSEHSRVVTGIINGEEVDLNYCSPRYVLIPNEMIFPKIEDVLNANSIIFSSTYKHINNVRFYADYNINDPRYSYHINDTNDIIQPMLRIQHSYNGLTKYKIIFGYFRLICSNGLSIEVETMKKYNLIIVGKHTEQILKSINELNIMLQNFEKNANQITSDIVEKYELLGGRVITNVEDRITEVLKAVNIRIVSNNKFNTINDIVSRITKEATNPTLGYNGNINDWLIYNGINQYLYSDRTVIAPEIRMEVDNKVLEYMLKNT